MAKRKPDANRECSHCNGGQQYLSQSSEESVSYRCLHCDAVDSELTADEAEDAGDQAADEKADEAGAGSKAGARK